MASVTITFRTSGAAFEDDYHGELASVLEQARQALTLTRGLDDYSGPLRDTNGNTVGRVEQA